MDAEGSNSTMVKSEAERGEAASCDGGSSNSTMVKSEESLAQPVKRTRSNSTVVKSEEIYS